MAAYMVDELVGEISVDGASARHSHLLRTEPLRDRGRIEAITFSGGVSEFVYGRATQTFGDLGPLIADELRRSGSLGAPIMRRPAASAPRSSAPRSTPSRSRAARSTCRRWTSCPYATFRS